MKKARILIVDDERSVRQALRFELEDEGYEIYYASDYDEALSAIRAFNIDLVITDVLLGDNDGIQLMENDEETKRQSCIYCHICFSGI